MNTNSQDVVKSVESKNVESTSNEQRQTNKPIVISRRRLLRAGAAGIPVVLTMVGIAPGQSIQTQASAASGLMYGGHLVHDRFAGDNTIVRDGLVWTDHNGFVLLNEGGVKTEGLTVTTDTSATGTTTFDITGEHISGTQPEGTTAPTKTFTVSIDKPTNLSVNAYLHKTGVWYTDRIVRTGTPTELLEYIEALPLTIKDGATELNSNNTTSLALTPEEATFTSTGDEWYKSKVHGWKIEDGYANVEQDYYLLPATTESNIDSVNYNAKVSFTYKEGDYTYTCNNQTVQIPLKLIVSGIPNQVNPGGI